MFQTFELESTSSSSASSLGKVIEFQNKVKDQVRDVQTGTNKSEGNTIFHHVLASQMPESEKSLGRLWQEGMVVVGAGTETTAWTLVVGLTYIMMNDNIRQLLETELQEAKANTGFHASLLIRLWKYLETRICAFLPEFMFR
ncbi:hypothetical protein N0V95_005401 [Ascochyta clinopodiicola]|nr:hypothetical protein N0V95_005401 [Ascochyta clinopodiicola]